jgi:peptidoglycan/xylan/chitin deacetylase (PgdA/CDA1 family)
MFLHHIDRILSVYLVAPFCSGKSSAGSLHIPILMYHSVSDSPEPGVAPYYRLATPPALFAEHLQLLSDRGYSVVSLHEATHALTVQQTPNRRLAVITFDDGFRDFLTNAWPALNRLSFTATVFLPTNFIGDSSRSFVGRDCLTWSEIRELRKAGISFGSHTASHPKMDTLSESQLEHELVDSKSVLEERLQEPIDSFCHPYAFPAANASYVSRFRELLKRAGYRIATNTSIGRARSTTDHLLLPRLPVNGRDDARLFTAKLAGAYDWFARPQSLLKRAKRILRPTS